MFVIDKNGTPRQSGLANQGRAILRKFGRGQWSCLDSIITKWTTTYYYLKF